MKTDIGPKMKTRILVVDDEEVVRLAHLRVLESAHCSVVVVANGAEALQALEQQPFDVALLDLRMPGVDGMSLLKIVKERWPETAVIVITGYPSIDTAKEAVRLGAYNYLSKPVGPDEVISAANDAVMQKKWALHSDRSAADSETRTRAVSL